MSSTCDHPPWQKCLKCLGVKKEDIAKIKPKCTHDPSTKCPNCASSTDVSEFKHVPFEFYFGELRKKCKGTHPPSAKCQNCMPPQEYFYRIKEGCPNHKKYPDGICNKCMPQAAVISRQKFRHVDYVSFMNKEELQQFYNIFDKNKFLKQQMAFLYGYYSEDPTYPDGVRVNVEALYMPKQVGNDSTIEIKPDEFQASADKVAEALSLEKVGVIFTSSFSDVEFLSTEQIIESAKYQEAHKYEHPIGMHVSKWITAILKCKIIS
jgi:nuclear protein localization protein 4 homolog